MKITEQVLGKGNFGRVHAGCMRFGSRHSVKVAVKRIDRQGADRDDIEREQKAREKPQTMAGQRHLMREGW